MILSGLGSSPAAAAPSPRSARYPLPPVVLHLLQLRRDAAVVHRAADARDDAADDRRIDVASPSVTVRPVTSASPRSMRLRASGGKRRRRRHLCAHDLLVVEQPLAVGREQIRQQHEPIALGEQRRAAWRESATCRARSISCDHRGALARHRHGRVQQHLLERRVLREQVARSRRARRSIASCRSRVSLTATSRSARA